MLFTPFSRVQCAAASLLAALAFASVPAWAASSTASAASDSVGALSGSVSGSFERSSDSSATKKVAQGDYRVVAVAAVAQKPGMVRVTLQALATPGADGVLLLTLPQPAFERSALGAGQNVLATTRPYGVEFARSDTKVAFFLVLEDQWMNEMDSRPVI